MNLKCAVIALAAVELVHAQSQSEAPAKLEFDVASVKPGGRDSHSDCGFMSFRRIPPRWPDCADRETAGATAIPA
jgi:hypothetical protein